MIDLNIQSYQLAIEYNIFNWDAIDDIGQSVMKVRDAQKQYVNDIVEIQQVVDFGRVTDRSHRILIIINLKRDLDNLDEEVIL